MRYEMNLSPDVFDALAAGFGLKNMRSAISTEESEEEELYFLPGDSLCLRKMRHATEILPSNVPGCYTGDEIEARITHKLRGKANGLNGDDIILVIDIVEVRSALRDDIDRKYKIEAVNPCSGNLHNEKDAVLFLAKDKAFLLGGLPGYRAACVELNANPAHIESVDLLMARVRKFQDEIEAKVPDTDLPCEIRRCIDGEGC